MKRQLSTFIILIAITVSAQEGKILFGTKLGMNWASITNTSASNEQSRIGIHIGVIVEIPLTDKFAFAPEVMYSAQGEISNINGTDGPYESITVLDYINVPLMAKYYMINNLAIEVGPQIGVFTGGGQELRADERYTGDLSIIHPPEAENDFNTIDLGITIGVSYRLPIGIFLQTRYLMGLSDITKSDFNDFNNRNSAFQISLGYMF